MRIPDKITSGQIAPVGAAKKAEQTDKTEKTESVSEPVDQLVASTKYPIRDGNYVVPLENGDKILDKIDKMMTGAEKSIQVQVYKLGHTKMVNLLKDQAQRGVKVQLLLDPTPGYNPVDAENRRQIEADLKAAGVEILKYPINGPSGKIDHVKMMIVDGKSLLIGGMNWDPHSPENQDSNIYVEGPVVADSTDLFQADWKLAGGENITGLPVPKEHPKANAKVRIAATEVDRQDIRTVLQDNINKAEKTIRMEAFALADKETIENLAQAAERGVDVKILLDPGEPVVFVNRKAKDTLEKRGVEVRWWSPDYKKREKLHSKLATFDDDKVIIGSANFTNAGLTINHEASAEVISEAVGTAFNKMFDEHWENKSVSKPPYVPNYHETMDETPVSEKFGKELYRYFTSSYHPEGTKRIWAGNRKARILEAIDEYSRKDKPAPVYISGGDVIDEEKEAKTIGDLASFFAGVENFKSVPEPGSHEPIYDTRVRLSKEAAAGMEKDIPRMLDDMVKDIKTKDIRDFVKDIIDNKMPKGFLKAPSSSTGKWHPADEVDPAAVDIANSNEYGPYPGGGLVLHTRRCQIMAGKLCDHYGIKGRAKDEILAAMVLHDMMKGVDMQEMKDAMAKGEEIPWHNTTKSDHGHVAAEWIKLLDPSKDGKFTQTIRDCVADHMGVWNKPEPSPPNKLPQFIVSMADYSVSNRDMYLEV